MCNPQNHNLSKVVFVDMKIKHNKESLSGRGSHIVNTKETVKLINKIIKTYNVKSILDLGCGDWNWFKNINLEKTIYVGWDAHNKMIQSNNKKYGNNNITFQVKDIITNKYPKVDLIICRDVLFHLNKNLSLQCINKIKKSCKYFISTSFNTVLVNTDIKKYCYIDNWGFYKINLNIHPFNLDKYLSESVNEKHNSYDNYKRYINFYKFSNNILKDDTNIYKMKSNQKQLIIIDNFYDNVDKVREFVIKQEFNVKGNYPGARTKSYKSDDTKKIFEQIIGKKITYWPDKYNGSFQYTTKNMKSWIHRDQTSWAGLLYLTPNAPLVGGTAFFRHKETGIENKKEFNKLSKEKQKLVDNNSSDMSKWEMIDRVGNKYNRLILFRGSRNHRSMEYFGKDKYDGRLFQLWFFNVDESSHIPSVRPILSTTLNLEKLLAKKICVLFFTTSRYEYLIPTLESFHKNVNFGYHQVYKILIDDYPLRRKTDILEKLVEEYKIDKLVLNPENLGYSVTWKNAWNMIPSDTDYVWHQEDDFTFNKIIDVNNMIGLLHNNQVQLFQVHLKRNIVFESNDFIRKIENNKCGKEMDIGGQKIVVSKSYFNPNPGIYPYWVTKENYAKNLQEGVIIGHLTKKYVKGYSAMLGGRHDKNLINHIGEYTQGKKVLPGEPGWEWLKKYDPTKKYYSAKYLTPYVEKKSNIKSVSEVQKIDYYKKAEEKKRAKDYIEAIKIYEKVVENKDRFSEEQIYWSLYSIGFCREKMGHDFEKVVLHDYLKSFNYRKSRLEGLFKILCYLRNKKGDNKRAFSYGMMGYPICSTKDKLNVNKSIYDYHFIFELSISAYYIGFYQLSYDLTKKIINEGKHPKHWNQVLKGNIKFSENKLNINKPKKKEVIPSIKIGILITSTTRGLDCKNYKDTHFYNIFLDSFFKTYCKNYLYTIYVVIDDDDKIYSKKEEKDNLVNYVGKLENVKMEFISSNGIEKGWVTKMWNRAFKKAYDDGCEYFYQCGDDVQILDGNWVTDCVKILKEHKDIGVTGPIDWLRKQHSIQNNYEEKFLLTQSFVSRKHMEYFGFFFPPEIKNWFCDDWITFIYQKHNMLHKIKHRIINKGGKPRYTPNVADGKLCTQLIQKYSSRLNGDIMSKLFWQYPVITEKTFAIQNKGEEKYLGIPWSTILDKKFSLDELYQLLHKNNLIGKDYYTCCQHISFRKLLPFFHLIGIKIVYSPHKVLGQDKINGITILPCPLYSVNIEDPKRNEKMKGLNLLENERPFLYSFAGGWQKDYLTDIRPRIFKLHDPNRKDIYIRNTGDWHFNRVVYNSKQNKKGDLNEDTSHKQKSQDYLELLLNSRYTLSPSGSGPNSIRFWEALGVGSIPVLLADTLELPKHELWKDAIVKLHEKDLEKIDEILADISTEKEKEMRKNCLKLYNHFKTNYANRKIKKNMVIFTNCHGEKYLKIFKRDSNVHDIFNINYIVSYQQLNNFDSHKKAFEVADVLIINNIKNYNQFTLNNIKKLMKKDAQLIVLPFVRFNGYWLPEKTKRLSKIGSNSVEHFPDIDLADVDNYITKPIDSEIFQNHYIQCLNKLKAIEKESDIKFNDFFVENHLKYPMFRDAYHPTLNIIEYIGTKLLQLIEKQNDIIVKKSPFTLLKETNEYGHYKPIKDSVKNLLDITYDLDKVFICDRKTYLERILEYETKCENKNIKDLDEMLVLLTKKDKGGMKYG